MIYDRIENLERYFESIPQLAIVKELLRNNLYNAEPGMHETADKTVRFNRINYCSNNNVLDKMEIHKVNMDVQVCLEGGETFHFNLDNKSNEDFSSYNNESDALFIKCKDYFELPLIPNRFVIFFPGEAHMGNFPLNGKALDSKKVVFKVLI